MPLIVLVSDGDANVAMAGGEARAESLQVARRIRDGGFDVVVIDTAPTPDRRARIPRYHDLRAGAAARVAEALGGLLLHGRHGRGDARTHCRPPARLPADASAPPWLNPPGDSRGRLTPPVRVVARS